VYFIALSYFRLGLDATNCSNQLKESEKGTIWIRFEVRFLSDSLFLLFLNLDKYFSRLFWLLVY
jgi:hypothetical protein